MLGLALALALALVSAFATAPALAQPPGPTRAAIHAPLVTRSLFLDGDAAGHHMVIVGERGHILVSRDAGLSWSQADVPTRATLTGVILTGEDRGFAVGHDAVILRTADGGDSWTVVFSAPDEERPLLDVWFENPAHGIAVGAYGYFLETRDGGTTWQTRHIAAQDSHLNHIAAAPPARLYVAGERGALYRSDDAGRTWRQLPSPYAGSLFGTLPLDDARVFLYGLRGHLFYSVDGGEAWQRVATHSLSLLTDGIRVGADRVLFTGNGGTFLSGGVASFTLDIHQRTDRAGVAGVLDAGDGALVVFGEFGVERIAADAVEPAP